MAPRDDPRARVSRVAPARARWFRAPGRVNLMGDHTDYNDGFVLPFAIELETIVAAAPAASGFHLRSLDEPGEVTLARDDPPWGRYAAGLVRVLRDRGIELRPLEAVVASSVPVGSGLSSSAALEVSLALALLDAAGTSLEPRELARACQAAEHLATGVPSGIMDQLASVCGRAEHAVRIDCRNLEIAQVPLPATLAVVVVHSGIPRTLERSEYADRRAACERIAGELGLQSLREATLEQVADRPLARHVVTENGRVLATAAALAAGDLDALPGLFLESHASLRDDFRVSTPELDALVEGLVAAGALGARLTGAGFGGCVVGVCRAQDAAAVGERATASYRASTGLDAWALATRATDGAGRLS